MNRQESAEKEASAHSTYFKVRDKSIHWIQISVIEIELHADKNFSKEIIFQSSLSSARLSRRGN